MYSSKIAMLRTTGLKCKNCPDTPTLNSSLKMMQIGPQAPRVPVQAACMLNTDVCDLALGTSFLLLKKMLEGIGCNYVT